ncbi:MAG: hypothetical protein HFI86_05780 [Bacilli bacterium]|nr:hypothetical protein [Bacilli bacterium]
MNEKDSLKLAKDLLNDINEKIRRLSNILDRIEGEYEFNLETIDYSTIGSKKTYAQLNVTLKQDLPSLW